MDHALQALRIVFRWAPWKRDRVSRAVGRYLDGDERALDKMPTVRAELDLAAHLGNIALAPKRKRTRLPGEF